jgi:TolB-like protein/DNA-binding winged helix-turn-helix (wHTH) protein
MRYQFNGFEIDTLQFKLFCAGKAVSIEPKDFDLIVYLIKNRHRTVTRDEIFNVIWQGQVVSDSTLTNHIKSSRKILGDSGDEQNVISTIRGRGYQFIAATEEILDNDSVILPTTSRLKLAFQVLILILLLLIIGIMIYNFESPHIKKNSIAVLPFLNVSGDPDDEYLSDGISEEIINTLSHVSGLHVISRSSSFQFKGKEIDTPGIAEQLGVAYVLEGAVRKSDKKIRITVQLIKAKNDRQIWGATFNRELVDIVAVQTEISTAIVVALKKELGDNIEDTILESTTIFFNKDHLKKISPQAQ